jgi:hypothetical protein
MLVIPLNAAPSQTLTVPLSGQPVQLNITQRSTGLFMDVILNGTMILSQVACLNANLIVRNTYFGFVGDFAFYDTQGLTDPVYAGLGSRYILVYFTPADLGGLG